ncbi:hypothetical protein PR202_gb17283 [Eleusine coracana subsp. coracana]|uniref:Uncharacterized protein n=1 Tax=Eleusine coracana subsp. coracana TaxID=191504 RepID=A0AAV5F2C8_ELECO|nr:hypothetical protein PR202_gb17283 [Eleusine coracana subsp. coracana]
MRLPKAQVEKLMSESKDGAEAAARIMQLCAAANAGSGAATPERAPTPERYTRFAATPEWGTGFMMPATGAGNAARTPERWPTLPRTPEYEDVKASRKEVRMQQAFHLSLPDFFRLRKSIHTSFQASLFSPAVFFESSTTVLLNFTNSKSFANIWINRQMQN